MALDNPVDVVGGIHVQRVKIGTGTAGSYDDASTSNPVPVSLTGTGIVGPAAPGSFALNSAASTNDTLVHAASCGLQCLYATNTGAAAAYVKLYNKATAPNSADTPLMVIVLPAAAAGVPGVANLEVGFSGFRYSSGLGLRITGGAADADTTAVAAGQVKVMLSRSA